MAGRTKVQQPKTDDQAKAVIRHAYEIQRNGQRTVGEVMGGATNRKASTATAQKTPGTKKTYTTGEYTYAEAKRRGAAGEKLRGKGEEKRYVSGKEYKVYKTAQDQARQANKKESYKERKTREDRERLAKKNGK